MKKNIFADLHFNEEHRATIRDKMQTNVEKEFFTLLTERKTATELIQLLHVKGVKSIWQNEGIVFIKLHQAELEGDADSISNEQDEKSYNPTKKGLQKYGVAMQSILEKFIA